MLAISMVSDGGGVVWQPVMIKLLAKRLLAISFFNMGSDSYCEVSSELSKQILSLIASFNLQLLVADLSEFGQRVGPDE